MTRFEFNSVLVSILLAFATAELVTTWGRVLRAREPVRFSWPYGLLSLWVFFSVVLHWFGLWAYREVPFDRALHSFTVVLPAVVMALLTHVLTPGPGEEHELGEHYWGTHRRALPLAAAAMLLSGAIDLLLPGVTDAAPAAFFVASAASFLALLATRRPALHTTVIGANAIMAIAVLIIARS